MATVSGRGNGSTVFGNAIALTTCSWKRGSIAVPIFCRAARQAPDQRPSELLDRQLGQCHAYFGADLVESEWFGQPARLCP
jgi:hypothetical protein